MNQAVRRHRLSSGHRELYAGPAPKGKQRWSMPWVEVALLCIALFATIAVLQAAGWRFELGGI